MIYGKRFILEAIDPDNIEIMRSWRNDPAKRKYFREFREISKEMQDQWYKSKGNNTNKDFIYFQIKNRDSGQLLGCCGLLYINWYLKSAELSMLLGQESKADREEISEILCNYGFKDIGLNKIWLEVYEINPITVIYEEMGFSKDGKLRANCIIDGEFQDSIIYSMLKSEWKK